MKTINHQTPSQDLFSQFIDNKLNHREMFAVRGGDNDTNDTGDEGSTLDQQEDGFN